MNNEDKLIEIIYGYRKAQLLHAAAQYVEAVKRI